MELTTTPLPPVIRQLAATWTFVRRWPVIPAAVIVVLVLMGVFGPYIAPHDPVIADARSRHLPPVGMEVCVGPRCKVGSWTNPLGTDHVGRDVLSRIIVGSRISLIVAALSLVVGLIVGTSVGMISGYLGGIFDEIITRIVDIWLALPFLMVALLVVLIFGQSIGVVFLLLAVLSWVGFVRVVRAQTLQLERNGLRGAGADSGSVAGADYLSACAARGDQLGDCDSDAERGEPDTCGGDAELPGGGDTAAYAGVGCADIRGTRVCRDGVVADCLPRGGDIHGGDVAELPGGLGAGPVRSEAAAADPVVGQSVSLSVSQSYAHHRSCRMTAGVIRSRHPHPNLPP